MNQQHDAPEGGAEKPVVWRCRCSWWDDSRSSDYLSERPSTDYAYNIVEPLYAAPTPPAPSGLVDAVRAYRKALAEIRARTYSNDRGCALQAPAVSEICDLATAALDATLSGQQGGAVPAGDLEAEVRYWRRDAAVRLWNARTLLDTHERYDDEEKALIRRDTMRTTLAAVDEIAAKAWGEPDEIADDLAGQVALARARLADQPAPAELRDPSPIDRPIPEFDFAPSAFLGALRQAISKGQGLTVILPEQATRDMLAWAESAPAGTGADGVAPLNRALGKLTLEQGKRSSGFPPEAIQFEADELLALGSAVAKRGARSNGVEGLRVKPLDWHETFTDRGDGTQEVTDWEAATGFGEWYSVESFMSSDSYGYQALLGSEVLKNTDDPDAAKAHAQADYERRIRAALDASSSEEGR